MTLTVNGLTAEPGCYVDGHWGQYGGVHLLDQAEDFTSTPADAFTTQLIEIRDAWPMNSDDSLCGAYGSDRDAEEGRGTGPWAAIQNFGNTDGQIAMDLADATLDALNEVTEGGYWEWYEGECFLRSYICPQCFRDARDLIWNGDEATGEWTPPACDWCCDADDPGCFA